MDAKALLVFMNSYCGCHYFHTVLVQKKKKKRRASQRELNEIFTAFFLIRTDGHAGVCTVNCCRFIHIRRDSGRRHGVKNPTPIYKSEIIFTLPSEDFYIEMKRVEG